MYGRGRGRYNQSPARAAAQTNQQGKTSNSIQVRQNLIISILIGLYRILFCVVIIAA